MTGRTTATVKGDRAERYEASGLTSFAGQELIARFLRALNFKGHLRRIQASLPVSDFGSVPMVLLVLVMPITGARRVRHVGYVEGDPLVEQICGLGRMPSQHTLGLWLRAFDDRGVKALHSVNERLVGEIIDRSDLRRLTLDADDGYYEYSAIVANKSVSGRTLWFFLCGLGTHEKVYGELKGSFAFNCVPTQRYEANSVWQIMSILAFNLMRTLQASLTERRKSNRKRRAIHLFKTIHTLRYQFINRTGLLVQPNSRSTHDAGNNSTVRERFQAVEQAISA